MAIRPKKLVVAITLVAFVTQPAAAYAQVVPEGRAPANLRPLVESTANGLPLVQITAPSAAGVSRNQYLQFNVDPQGLILNNAVTIAKTQQAGYVDGNPFLGQGAARVILNEVTGGDLSRLRGYTEVAGQRAEVVIANPNGITCNGCGFINASRGVLTTGIPVMGADGGLAALNVSRGLITVEGSGFHGGDADRVDLISRAVSVNADLWANHLEVVAGANRVDYASLGAQPIPGEGDRPGVSIDVAALGGMYANRIRLVGTEAGVGVNSRGTIAALQGDFTVTAEGRVVLSGTTSVAGSAYIAARQGFDNAGSFYSQSGARVDAAGSVANTGSLVSGGGIAVRAGSVDQSGTLAAGVDPTGALGSAGDVSLTAAGRVRATGTTVAAGALTLEGGELDLSGAQLAAGTAALRASTGGVDAGGAAVGVDGALSVVSSGAFRHDGAVTTAGALDVNVGTLSNRGGFLGQTGTGATVIAAGGLVDNTDGIVATNATRAEIRAAAIDNARGAIEHSGDGTLALSAAGSVGNAAGLIASRGALDLHAATLDNAGGALVAGAGASIATAHGLINAGGEVRAGHRLRLSAGGAIDNRGGTMDSDGAAEIAAGAFDNRGGRVAAVGTEPLRVEIAGALDNSRGLLGGNGDASVAAQSIANREGRVLAGGSLDIASGSHFDNAAGVVASGDALALRQPGALTNDGGLIQAAGSLSLETGALSNASGRVEAGKDADVTAGPVANAGGSIAAARDAALAVTALTGAGKAAAGRDLSVIVSGDYTHLAGSEFTAGRDLNVVAGGHLANHGSLAAPELLYVGAGSLANEPSGRIAAAVTTVDVADLLANRGRIEGDDLWLRAGAVQNVASVVGDRVAVNAGALTNEGTAALIGATELLALYVPGQLTNRDGASLYSLGDMTISGAPARGADGRFTTPTALLLNESAYIEADGGLEIAASEIVNRRANLVTGTEIIGASSQWYTTYPGWPILTSGYDSETGQTTYSYGFIRTPVTKSIAADDVLEHDEAARRLVFNDVKQEVVTEFICEGSSDGDFCGNLTRIAEVPTVSTAYYESLSQSGDSYSVYYYPEFNPNAHIHPTDVFGVLIAGRWHFETNRFVDKVLSEERVVAATPEPRIASGGAMRLDVSSSLRNEFGLVAAGGSLATDAGKVVNVGRDLLRTETRNRTSLVEWHDPCGRFESDCGHSVVLWPMPPEQSTSVAGTVRGVVAANQSLTIAARSVENVSVAAAGSPVGAIGSTSVVPTATSLPGARSVDPLGPGFTLPSGGLFRVSAPNPNYLIETDPRFADYRAFISSDYMLSRLALSPGTTTKRLGDGFYEARLVRDEIYRLSGRRYLSAYSSDTEQFQALMENGIAFAAALQLSSGIALTAEQMVALTHDIVWLEEREVALPDGRVERVLVPVVYLAAIDPGDLKPSGALIAANDLVLRTTDAVTNTGIIRGGERALVDAGSVRNVGGTIASRGLTDVTAQTDVVNRSGVIRGVDVSIMAGRDIRNETAVQQLTAGNAAIGATSTLISQRGAITAERDAVVAAGRDVVISGAEVRAGGDAAIGAGGSVTLDTVEARQGRHLYLGGSHSVTESTSQIGSAVGAGNDASIGAQGDVTLRAAGVAAGRDLTLQAGGDIGVGAARDTVSYDAESRGRKGSYGIVRTYDETVVGSSLAAGRDVTLAAGSGGAAAASGAAPDSSGNITVTGSSIGSDAGAIALVAPGNVTVEAESERHTRFAESVSKSGSAFSKKTVEERRSSDLTLARSATVSGESVTIISGDSVTVRGSNIVAADDVAIVAAKDLTIATAQQSLATESYRSEKKSGAFASGGFGITVGKQSITERETEDSLTNLGSTVGSVQGRATLVAGEAYRQSGSEVLAPRGIDISARDVTIDAAQDTFRTTYSYEAKQSGLSVGLAGGVVSPLVTAKDSIDRRSEVEDDRLKAVYAYRTGRNVYEAGTQAAEAMAGNKALFEVQVSIGSSQQRVDSQTDATRAVGSTVASAGDVAIAATGGAPGRGNLAVTGSSVTGANVALSAANELALRAAANTSTSQTIESGKAGSMGVGFGIGGKGAGISVFASASRMSGNTAGDSTTWTESQITAADLLVLQSGGDAQVVGAQARGERIEAVVGGELTLQSLQDVDVYRRDVRQSGASAGYTFGAGGPSGSASANRSRIDSDYLSVREQSGLFAGAGGFGLEVAGHTELTGAVIASAAAPDQNRLATGTLGYGNLANRAEYESSSSGGAIGFGPGSLPIPTPVLGVSGGDEAASLTLAAMAPGAIAIRNPANQTQALSALSRDPEASHRALAAIFDPREAAERQELAQGFGQEAFRAVGDIASIFTRPYEKAQSDEAIARGYLALKAKGELTEEERALVAIYELRGALTPEKAAQQIEDAIRQQEITRADHDAWKEGSLNKTLLHGFIGALQASFGGADALSGALGAGAAEASRTLTEQLPKELQQWASAVVGAAAGAMAGGGSAGIQTGAATAWSGEVYNRQLHPKETAWIAQNAGRFAKELGISEEEAKTRLALQAAKDVDFLWRSGLAPGDDDAARVFLAKADETFLNERGNAQRLFTTELGQYFAFQQGVFDADRQFYRSYLTPNVTRDIATGAREEAKRMGLDAWGAVRSDPLGVAGALASGLYEAGVAMVLDPQSAIVGAYDRFMASGQDIGTGFGAALDPALRDPLNALYGQDVSGAVAIATAANAAATVGTVFGAGKVAGIAGEAAFDAAKLASVAAAKRINEAILGMAKGPLRIEVAEKLAFDLGTIEAYGLSPERVLVGTAGKVAVIGRVMGDEQVIGVRKYAEALSSIGYQVEIFDGPLISGAARLEFEQITAGGRVLTNQELLRTKIYLDNKAWAQRIRAESYTIIDLGNPFPETKGFSPFYSMEKRTIFGAESP